jgi:hypothetical protein
MSAEVALRSAVNGPDLGSDPGVGAGLKTRFTAQELKSRWMVSSSVEVHPADVDVASRCGRARGRSVHLDSYRTGPGQRLLPFVDLRMAVREGETTSSIVVG